jgi:hypothetical protein
LVPEYTQILKKNFQKNFEKFGILLYLYTMKELVNKFLDIYCSEEIVCVESRTEGVLTSQKVYSIKSGNVTIVYFSIADMKKESLFIYRSNKICDVVQEVFSVNKNESTQYVKEWIGNKLGLKKVRDLIKLIPK